MAREFGEWLRFAREESNLTQLDLGQKTSLDPTLVSKIESGERRVKPEIAIRLLETLNIPHEQQAAFLLSAVGFPPEVITNVLTGLGNLQLVTSIQIVETHSVEKIKIPPKDFTIRVTFGDDGKPSFELK